MTVVAITESDVSVTENGIPGTVGEAVASADVVYKKAADGKWWLAAAASDHGLTDYGLIVSGGVAANQQAVIFDSSKIGEVVTVGDVLTQGQIYVLSATSGKLELQSDLQAKVNEVQTVSVSGATSGTFTLTLDGQTTAAIAFDAAASAVETAIEALSNVDAVSVSGGPLNTAGVEVTFDGDVELMTVTNSTDGTVSVAETAAGYDGDYLFIVGHAKTSSELELLLKYTGDLVG